MLNERGGIEGFKNINFAKKHFIFLQTDILHCNNIDVKSWSHKEVNSGQHH